MYTISRGIRLFRRHPKRALVVGLTVMCAMAVTGLLVSALTQRPDRVYAATPPSLECLPAGTTCIGKPPDFGIALPWAQGRTVYRGSYTYGSNDHVGKDSYALDFLIGQGTGGATGHERDVRAIAAGTIVWVGWFDQSNQTGNTFHCYGNSVAIQHTYTDSSGNHYTSFYTHLASIDPAITLGAPVTQGQLLGIEGNTGSGLTGCTANMPEHLHFVLYASPSSVSTITNNGANPPDGNTNPANGTVTIESVVPEPFMGLDGENRPTMFENFEWFQGPMIASGSLATGTANPGGTWNAGTTTDGTQLAYDQPIQYKLHVTDAVNIAEVHLTVDYHPVVNSQTTGWSYPDTAFNTPVAFPSDNIWRILVVCKPGPPASCRSAQNAGAGSATWTGTATAADITFSWYPAREVGAGNLEIPSLVNWLPGSYPAQTPQNTAAIGACISFDVIDTAGVENLAPNGVNCVNGGYSPARGPHASVHPTAGNFLSKMLPLTSDPSHLITVNPAPSGTTCSPAGTWAGLITRNNTDYLNEYYNGQSDGHGGCAYYYSNFTLGSYVLPAGTYNLPADITVDSDTTLTIPTGSTLDVAGNIYVKGVLVVQPGVTFVFAPGSIGVKVQGGTVNMAGTSGQPIKLTTSAYPLAAGSWQGIFFDSANGVPSGGSLTYVQEYYAGATYAYGGNCIDSGVCYNTGIWLNGAGTNPTLSNVTVGNSYSNGIEVLGGASPSIENSTLTNNGIGTQAGNAVQYDSPPADLTMVSGLSASGNLHNNVLIGYGTDLGVGTWQNVGIPLIDDGLTLGNGAQLTFANGLNIQAIYGIGLQSTSQLTIGQNVTISQLSSSISVNAGSTLSVGAGTIIRVAPGANGIATNGGTINLNGTAAQPIVLTSASSTPASGDWQGLIYLPNNTTPAAGTVSYTTVRDAGATYAYGGNCIDSGVCYNTGILLIASSPTLTNLIVDHSFSNGIEIAGGANPSLSALTLTNNGVGTQAGNAIEYDYPPTNLTPTQLNGVSATGNLHNVLAIWGGGTYSGVGTWQNVGLPLNVPGYTFTLAAGAQLTIASGTPITQLGGFTLSNGASLTLGDGLSIPTMYGIGLQSTSQLTIGQNVTISQLSSSISVNAGSTLSVGAGTTIRVAPGANGIATNGGTINLNGTAAQPIVLTSASSTPASGDWQGLIYTNYNSTLAGGTASYVQVRYAGASFAFGGNCIDSGVCYNTGILLIASSPTLTNLIVDHSFSNGIEIVAGAAPSMTALTLTNNGVGTQAGNAIEYDYPPTNLTPTQLNGVSATGNLHNVLAIWGGGTYSGVGTWQNVGLPLSTYFGITLAASSQLTIASGTPITQLGGFTLSNGASLTLGNGLSIPVIGGLQAQSSSQLTIGQNVTISQLNGSLEVDAGSTLNVGAGTTIQVQAGGNYYTGQDALFTRGGTINLNGTAAQPIVLTSTSATPASGDWGGLLYLNNNSTPAGGTASYVQVRYAGVSTANSPNAAIYLNGAGTNPTLNNVTVDHSWGNDVEVNNGALPVLRDNNFGAVPSGHWGLTIDGWVSGNPMVDATYSWWGDPSGPMVNGNPGGKGVPIQGGVTFSPWVFGPVGVPTIILTPSSGVPGTTLSISASGFGSIETVSVFFNCSSIPCAGAPQLGSGNTDSQGYFANAGGTVPNTATVGSTPVSGRGLSTGDVASTVFTVTGAHMKLSTGAVRLTMEPTSSTAVQSIVLTNTGPEPLTWHLGWLPAWIAVNPASGTLGGLSSQSITITFMASKLHGPGNYDATLVLLGNADNAPLRLHITLTVLGRGIITGPAPGFATSSNQRWMRAGIVEQ